MNNKNKVLSNTFFGLILASLSAYYFGFNIVQILIGIFIGLIGCFIANIVLKKYPNLYKNDNPKMKKGIAAIIGFLIIGFLIQISSLAVNSIGTNIITNQVYPGMWLSLICFVFILDKQKLL